MNKKNFSLLVKILVSLAILYFLFYRFGFSFESFQKTIANIDYTVYFLSFFGVIIVLGIKSLRWQMLVKNEGYDYKPYRAFGAYMSSDAIGIVTPGRIGEIARLYYVRQETPIPFFEAFKTLVADRVFDFTMLGWFGLSGMTYYFKTLGDIPGIAYVVIVLVLLLLAYWIGLSILGWMSRQHMALRWQLPLFLYECLKSVIGPRSLQMWGLTLLAYFGYFYFSWLIMHSLGVKPGLVDVAFIMSIMSLSTIIPISVAGFGTREATLVLLFSVYSLPSETAVTFSLLHFTAFFLWGGIIGLFYWMSMPISLKQVKEDSIHIFELVKVRKSDSSKEHKPSEPNQD